MVRSGERFCDQDLPHHPGRRGPPAVLRLHLGYQISTQLGW